MNVRVLLVPYDSGRLRERMGRGPGHLLESAVAPLLARLGHRFEVVEIALSDPFPAEIKTAFAVCHAVAEEVRDALRAGSFPLVLSGNCNTAVGTVAGCGCADTSVVWFDAHGEATTPDTTTSGFLDGMGIAILTGRCWRNLAASIPGFEPIPGDRIVLVGARDLEPAEEALLADAGVRCLSRAEDIRPELLPQPVYVHLDLDVLDPAEAVANQWPTPGGLTAASIAHALSRLPVKAAGIASYDPAADSDGRAARAAATLLEALLSNR
jgi:arginase